MDTRKPIWQGSCGHKISARLVVRDFKTGATSAQCPKCNRRVGVKKT